MLLKVDALNAQREEKRIKKELQMDRPYPPKP